MMLKQLECEFSDTIAPAELLDFYARQKHCVNASEGEIARMLKQSTCVVGAWIDGKLVGFGRGICDGVTGFLMECKLDPAYQGPAAVTRTDGRIEHDEYGIAHKLASRVLEALRSTGAENIRTLVYGTEVDFCEELGFKRDGALIPLSLDPVEYAARRAGGSV